MKKILTFALGALLFAPTAIFAQSLEQTYFKVHKAIVFILVYKNGQLDASGTGFVISSNSKTSHILTAAHVVQGEDTINVYLNDDLSVRYIAKVIKADYTVKHDVALLEIHAPNLSALHLSGNVSTGEEIGAAGYSRASWNLLIRTKELTPTLHTGVVSAITGNGALIEHSATTNPGDSGGPVFDVHTGDVIGFVDAAWKDVEQEEIAIGYREIKSFLQTPIAKLINTKKQTAHITANNSKPSSTPTPTPIPTPTPVVFDGAGCLKSINDNYLVNYNTWTQQHNVVTDKLGIVNDLIDSLRGANYAQSRQISSQIVSVLTEAISETTLMQNVTEVSLSSALSSVQQFNLKEDNLQLLVKQIDSIKSWDYYERTWLESWRRYNVRYATTGNPNDVIDNISRDVANATDSTIRDTLKQIEATQMCQPN